MFIFRSFWIHMKIYLNPQYTNDTVWIYEWNLEIQREKHIIYTSTYPVTRKRQIYIEKNTEWTQTPLRYSYSKDHTPPHTLNTPTLTYVTQNIHWCLGSFQLISERQRKTDLEGPPLQPHPSVLPLDPRPWAVRQIPQDLQGARADADHHQ